MMLRSLLLCLVIATSAIAADEKKSFALPDGSKLELAIPAGWKDEPKDKAIFLTPREGAPFEVTVVPVGRQRAGASADTAVQMRQSVQQDADKVKPSAVESILTAEALAGAPGPGYYFSATDRDPKPGEWKHLTQGMLLVGDVIVSFAILTNDGQEKVRDQALAMLKSASLLAR